MYKIYIIFGSNCTKSEDEEEEEEEDESEEDNQDLDKKGLDGPYWNDGILGASSRSQPPSDVNKESVRNYKVNTNLQKREDEEERKSEKKPRKLVSKDGIETQVCLITL
jgi:hypothetical protein